MAVELNTSKLTPDNHVLLVRWRLSDVLELRLTSSNRTSPSFAYLMNLSNETFETHNATWKESETTSCHH